MLAAHDAANVAVISFAFFNGLGTAATMMSSVSKYFHARARHRVGPGVRLYRATPSPNPSGIYRHVFTVSAIHIFYATVCALGAAFIYTSIPRRRPSPSKRSSFRLLLLPPRAMRSENPPNPPNASPRDTRALYHTFTHHAHFLSSETPHHQPFTPLSCPVLSVPSPLRDSHSNHNRSASSIY